MNYLTRDGKTFDQSDPDEVIDFLKTRDRKQFTLEPERLRIAVTGKELTLQISGGITREYPLRSSFFHKLLKWYSFPVSAVSRLNGETVASILNDHLLAIKGKNVIVTVEDGDALTITSERYTELSDLTVIEYCHKLGIESISRDDFVTRIYSVEKARLEPIVGDPCGFGYNVFNSETGFSPVSVSHYVLRYVCSNGAVARLGDPRKEERIHYRISPSDLELFLKQRVNHAEKSRDKLVRSLKKLPLIRARKKYKLIKGHVRRIAGKEIAAEIGEQIGEETTMYDLFNLMTDHAKVLSISRKLQLESLAGEFLV